MSAELIAQLIEAVREHARQAEDEAWQLIEACTDEELAEMIGKSRTAKGAIAKVAAFVETAAGGGADADVEACDLDGEPSADLPEEAAPVLEELPDVDLPEEAAPVVEELPGVDLPEVDAEALAADAPEGTEPADDGQPPDGGPAEETEHYARQRSPEEVDQQTGEVTEAAPYAVTDVQPVPVTVYKARIQVVTPQADGSEATEWFDCPHQRYGHETEAAALRCAKAEAGKKGVKVRA